jgi:hypothetical protein
MAPTQAAAGPARRPAAGARWRRRSERQRLPQPAATWRAGGTAQPDGDGQNGSNSGGVFGANAGSSTTVQIGYQGTNWRLAAAAAWIENGFGIIDYGSPFVLSSYENPGVTSSYALSGTWQPQRSGWWPSISAGRGLNQTRYDPQVRSTGLVSTSQSWTLALQWEDVLLQGNAMGGAIGQPIVATALVGGATPNDSSLVAEWWYQARITDAITMTPALHF